MNLTVLFAWHKVSGVSGAGLAQHLHQPVHTFAYAFAVNDRTGNNAPIPIPQFAQLECF
jgi:hypothetical protein